MSDSYPAPPPGTPGSFIESFYGKRRADCPLLSASAVERTRAAFTDTAFFGSPLEQKPGLH